MASAIGVFSNFMIVFCIWEINCFRFPRVSCP